MPYATSRAPTAPLPRKGPCSSSTRSLEHARGESQKCFWYDSQGMPRPGLLAALLRGHGLACANSGKQVAHRDLVREGDGNEGCERHIGLAVFHALQAGPVDADEFRGCFS